MKEDEEGFEAWDADFLDQLIQVEELALSSQLPSSSSSSFKSPPSTSTSTTKVSYLPPPSNLQPPAPPQDYQNNFVSFSPPRELSQRPIEFSVNNNNITFDRFSNGFSHSEPSASVPNHNAKDLEIDRLKRELERVSKQLIHLEHECSELRTEKKRKEEQIKSVYSTAVEKVPEQDVRCSNMTNLEHKVTTTEANEASKHSKNTKVLVDQIDYRNTASMSKAIGIQTERTIDFTNIFLKNDLHSCLELSEKLQGIWGSTSKQQLGRNQISKLFIACPADFEVLFGCMGMNMFSKVLTDSSPGKTSCHADLQCHMHSFPTSDAAKVSRFYSVLTKINNGVLQLEALFGPLLDLSDSANVAILSSSLHILHMFLKHLLCLGTKLEGGDNVKIEELCSGNSLDDQDLLSVICNEAPNTGCGSLGIRSFDLKHLHKKACWNVDISSLLSSLNLVSLFELMRQIAVRNTEECVRLDAISIMNVILMSSTAYTQREKFCQSPIFESMSTLLKSEAGSRVQKESLYLLFLLLNCSKLLGKFCSGCKEAEIADSTNDEKNMATTKGFGGILEGLANCIACSGNSIQDIELRRRAIIMLAFLASSGKSGFEIMVSCRLPGETNFLMLILQMLVSEMDVEASICAEPATSIKARTLLIREALILLNRLVSNAGYSATVLRLLTARRDMASLTIDIASRLSQEDHSLKQSDVARHPKESEIIELAQVFRKRVFAYLGDKIS